MKLRRPTAVHAWLLAAMLLLAQGVGLAHRVLHAPGLAAPWAQDHEAGGQQCRLIDQAAHADMLCDGQPAAVTLLRLGQAVLPPVARSLAAAAPAAYLARAPPRG